MAVLNQPLKWLAVFGVCAVWIGVVLLLQAQPPATPGQAAVATGTITILLNGQVIGAAPVLNLLAQSPGAGPSGILGSCVPNAALNSIDCGLNLNSVVAPTFGQLYANPLFCKSSNGTIAYVCSLNNFPGPPTVGMTVDLLTDTTCVVSCTLNLTGGAGPSYTIYQSDGATAPNGAIISGQLKPLWFDGTVLRII